MKTHGANMRILENPKDDVLMLFLGHEPQEFKDLSYKITNLITKLELKSEDVIYLPEKEYKVYLRYLDWIGNNTRVGNLPYKSGEFIEKDEGRHLYVCGYHWIIINIVNEKLKPKEKNS